MAKLLASCVFLLLVLCSVEAQKRCVDVLDPNACELSACRQKCYETRNGNGVCQADPLFNYRCICVYNCETNA